MTASLRPAIGQLEGPGEWMFSKFSEGIARWVLEAVGFFVEGAMDLLRSSARPDVEAAWFAGAGSPFATVRNLAAVLLVGFVFLGLLQGLLRGDPGGMAARMAVGLPLAVAGMVVTTSVAARLLELTDALSNAVLDATDEQALAFLSDVVETSTQLGSSFGVVVIGLFAVLAGLILWIELIVRSALIYLLVAISPIGFAATLWPAARGFLRKTVEILLAVIASKFVIALALSIGAAALHGAGREQPSGDGLVAATGGGLGVLLSGAVVLAMAAFAPFLVLKLVPVAEGAMLAQGISHTPARAAQSSLGTYSTVSRLAGSGRSASTTPMGTARATASSGGAVAGAVVPAAIGAMAAGAASGHVGRSTGESITAARGGHPELPFDEEAS